MKKAIWLVLLIVGLGSGYLQAQTTVSFNFSAGSQPVAGWINVAGDPSVAIRTATDPTSGISITSVATANWVPLSSSGTAAFDGGGMTNGTFFPAAVMLNHWFQTNPTLSGYNASVPQLEITGLKVDSVYTINMTGSWASSNYSLNPTQYTVTGATVYGYVDVNANFNIASGAVFHNVAPDATGTVKVYVNTVSTTQVADICGIQIIQTRTTAPTPVVSITNPVSNDVFPEDGNLTISATATETGGSITMVQFYAGSTLIGTDSTAPYSMVWYSPNEGPYTITARAVDGTGNTSTATVNISIEALTSFWSMTGNIGMNPDSNFVGNVDSVRLAFRTKNIERMSISPIGNVGIGIDTPSAQLHTTGSVRLAGIKSDSTKTRVLVSDTSGNLFYRNLGTLGATTGGGLGQSGDTLMLGDSIPGPGPHSFTSSRYQYLNGYQYSIGGSVNDPVNHPAFRIYDNGDFTAGSTMNRSFSYGFQPGLRYYSKLGLMQIGGEDWLDTTVSPVTYGPWYNSGILINTDNPNFIKGKLMNTVFLGDENIMDSASWMENCFVAGERFLFKPLGGGSAIANCIVAGQGSSFTVPPGNSAFIGSGHSISQPLNVMFVSGFQNASLDTARGSVISGGDNSYGGLSQLIVGNWLIGRTPYGVVLGNDNVDFSSCRTTGTQGVYNADSVAQYPLFALGNSSDDEGNMRSNAVTVLYNGRTQINTTGYTNPLTQTAVTPKAALEVVSTNSGVLLPKLTSAQRNAIATTDLQNGLLLYNTDSSVFQFYNGSVWNSVGSGTNAGSRWLAASGTTYYDSLDNVGIGTSNTQGYKLAVNGAGIFTKVRIKPQANWPDYVFKKDYHLPTLAELEQYITENNHLPGMISASEQAKDGIDVGSNQAALLQKIEELTLYVIQQNKAFEEQNKKLDQLQQANKVLEEQTKKLDQQQAQLQVQQQIQLQQQQEIDELKKLIRAKN